MMIPFGKFRPDIADLINPTASAINCIPSGTGYKPFPSLSVFSDALTARARAGFMGRANDGTLTMFAADQTKLYSLAANSFSDISIGGGYTGCPEDESWEFVQFGEYVIAVNINDAVQSFQLGTSSAFGNHITSTAVPKARHAAVIRDFLVLGNTNDVTDGNQPSRVWWSGINDSQDFDASQATQAGYQTLPDGGFVQRITGQVEYGLIFQDTIVRRMTYVGTPLIFTIQPIEKARGTPFPNAVIPWGRHVFYITEEGFMRLTDGSESVPIGMQKVDRWFWNQIDTNYSYRVTGSIWPEHKCVCWLFPGTGNTAGLPNKLLLYAWDLDEFSYADIELEVLFPGLTIGYTLDELDAAFGSDIDDATAYPLSLDSRFYMGGDFRLAGFNSSHKAGFFTGSNLAAQIDTGEKQLFPGHVGDAYRVRPVIDGSSVTATIKAITRNNTNVAVTAGSAISAESNGSYCPRAKARYHRFRVDTAAGDTWNHAVGMEIEEAYDRGQR